MISLRCFWFGYSSIYSLPSLLIACILGLKALTYVVQQDPNLALQHQMTIIECLDHPDPIIKREVSELLNNKNQVSFVGWMIGFLK